VVYQRLTPLPVTSHQNFCGEYCIEEIPADAKQAYGIFMLVMQLSRALPNLLSTSQAPRRRPASIRSLSCSNERQRTVDQRRQRTNIMLVLMVVVFTICWLPNSIYWLFEYARGWMIPYFPLFK
jgi:hypothetical protein